MSRLEAAVAELVEALRQELASERVEQRADRLLSIEEAAEMAGIGRTLIYREIQAGRLRSVLIGRRRLVPLSAVSELGRNAA